MPFTLMTSFHKEPLKTSVGAPISGPGLLRENQNFGKSNKQNFSQHDPDVDAIYRLTSTLPINFNTTRF